MKKPDCNQLTLYPEDSHANLSARLEKEKGEKMTVISGRKCLESFESCTPLGSLVKMLLASEVWNSKIYALRWKKSALKSGRFYFRLQASALYTNGIDSPYWPTPTVGGANNSLPKSCTTAPKRSALVCKRARSKSDNIQFEGVDVCKRKQRWDSEPGIRRMADGIPHQVDRLKCLGNAVVPQQFYPIFQAIAEIESF